MVCVHGGGGGGGDDDDDDDDDDDQSDNNHECVTPTRAPINNGHVPAMLSRQKFKATLGDNITDIWL